MDFYDLKYGNKSLGVFHPEPQTVEFWEGLSRGTLLLRSCSDCARAWHPLQITCLACRTPLSGWVESAGHGTVWSFSTVEDALGSSEPGSRHVGIIRLSEDVYFFGGIDLKDEEISIGMVVAFSHQSDTLKWKVV